MSLCIVCKSIPFRKLTTSGPEVVANDGFRFNAAGRTSSAASVDMAWNERRYTISEIVSRTKTCPLCANILLLAKNHRWYHTYRQKFIGWEEANAAISRNLMVRTKLFVQKSNYCRLGISLGNPRRSETFWLELDIRKTLGNLNAC
jgi:hypothetical protein